MAYTLHAVNHCKRCISLAKKNNLASNYLAYLTMYSLFSSGNVDTIELTLRPSLRTVNDQMQRNL